MSDPNEMERRRRAANLGQGYIEGQGAITDKGAKDFKEGMGAIQTTAKLGGFALIADMFTKITDLGNNPSLKILLSFFELFGVFLNAAGAENAKILAEALFTEENVQIMKDLAEATNDAMLSTQELTDGLLAWGIVFKQLAPLVPLLEQLGKALEPYHEEIEFFGSIIPQMNIQLVDFNSNLSRFSNLISNFRFPSGGGGGGDDDDTWWNPFD